MRTDPVKRIATTAAAMILIFTMGTGTVRAELRNDGDGTVTDTTQGLVWLKNATCFDMQTWDQARSNAASLKSGICGLTDKSTAGQWRLPTLDELKQRSQNISGDFTNFYAGSWWTSSDVLGDSSRAWYVNMNFGFVYHNSKSKSYYSWPVRAK